MHRPYAPLFPIYRKFYSARDGCLKNLASGADGDIDGRYLSYSMNTIRVVGSRRRESPLERMVQF